jgi:hypothetical protein
VLDHRRQGRITLAIDEVGCLLGEWNRPFRAARVGVDDGHLQVGTSFEVVIADPAVDRSSLLELTQSVLEEALVSPECCHQLEQARALAGILGSSGESHLGGYELEVGCAEVVEETMGVARKGMRSGLKIPPEPIFEHTGWSFTEEFEHHLGEGEGTPRLDLEEPTCTIQDRGHKLFR